MVMSAVPHPMSSRRAPGASGENRAWSHRAGSCRLSHCSGTKSCPPRKPPALRRHFYLFTFFDKEGNADLKTGLQRGWLGHAAARRVAPHTRFRGGHFQRNEHWQFQADGITVVLEIGGPLPSVAGLFTLPLDESPRTPGSVEATSSATNIGNSKPMGLPLYLSNSTRVPPIRKSNAFPITSSARVRVS